MLVSRQRDSEQDHWSSSKYETIYHKSASGLRMSTNFDGSLSTQSDWHGQQYSYLAPGENPIYAQKSGHETASGGQPESQPRNTADTGSALDMECKTASHTSSPLQRQRRSPGSPGMLQDKKASTSAQQPETEAFEHMNENSEASVDTPRISLCSNPLSSASSAAHGSELPPGQPGSEDTLPKPEDDDEMTDDDDMADGDSEAALAQMTPGERTAARRKMKRFRLTHQQTRFLMSEFAKQPHPDAAHRERLSREIPGLSPRQVQVWFQNRRAKIKRLTADDRERMIKMRAVPDDFDNVQALHSPYGAVHGLGTPMASPVGFNPTSYADHIMRSPLLVDVRRAEGGDHLPPPGLSPAYGGGLGFNSTPSMSNTDLLSPMSQESNDRFEYSSHSTPQGSGPRTSNPFTRQTSLEAGMPMHSHHPRQQMRPLQPLQLRETLNRSRSDNLQSPLRSSMSWKGSSIDYSTYPSTSGSPQPLNGRQKSVYQPPEGLSAPPTSVGPYESSTFASSNVTSPTHVAYPSFQSNSFQNSQNRSRLRATSANIPPGLDLSAQRPYSTSQDVRSATSPSHRHAAITSAPHTAGFPTAPLTAPSDFFFPKTTGFPSRLHDYTMPHMSAPMAPPNDFSQAFHSLSSGPGMRTPVRDAFGAGANSAVPLG